MLNVILGFPYKTNSVFIIFLQQTLPSLSLSTFLPHFLSTYTFTKKMDKKLCNSSQDVEVRKGPWTMEEDLILINYIANHGEGVWNSLARSAGNSFDGSIPFLLTLVINIDCDYVIN